MFQNFYGDSKILQFADLVLPGLFPFEKSYSMISNFGFVSQSSKIINSAFNINTETSLFKNLLKKKQTVNFLNSFEKYLNIFLNSTKNNVLFFNFNKIISIFYFFKFKKIKLNNFYFISNNLFLQLNFLIYISKNLTKINQANLNMFLNFRKNFYLYNLKCF